MIKIDDIEYRNLEEQVGKNQEDIKGLKFGLDIVGRVDSIDQIPAETEAGGTYLVGTAAPYNICTKIDDTTLLDLGTLASTVTGPKGEKGDTGETGKGVSSAYLDGTTLHFTFTDGTDVLLSDIEGPRGLRGLKGDTGETGPKGDKGDQGERGETGVNFNIIAKLLSISQLPDPEDADANDAYLIQTATGHDMYIIVGRGWFNSGPMHLDDEAIAALTLRVAANEAAIEELPTTDGDNIWTANNVFTQDLISREQMYQSGTTYYHETLYDPYKITKSSYEKSFSGTVSDVVTYTYTLPNNSGTLALDEDVQLKFDTADFISFDHYIIPKDDDTLFLGTKTKRFKGLFSDKVIADEIYVGSTTGPNIQEEIQTNIDDINTIDARLGLVELLIKPTYYFVESIDTFLTRETGEGQNVIDNSDAKVLKIAGHSEVINDVIVNATPTKIVSDTGFKKIAVGDTIFNFNMTKAQVYNLKHKDYGTYVKFIDYTNDFVYQITLSNHYPNSFRLYKLVNSTEQYISHIEYSFDNSISYTFDNPVTCNSNIFPDLVQTNTGSSNTYPTDLTFPTSEFPIPPEIQALPGYGVEGNIVDFENKTYTQNNEIVDNVVTPLSEPVKTDIDDYIPGDTYKVWNHGIETFDSEVAPTLTSTYFVSRITEEN